MSNLIISNSCTVTTLHFRHNNNSNTVYDIITAVTVVTDAYNNADDSCYDKCGGSDDNDNSFPRPCFGKF